MATPGRGVRMPVVLRRQRPERDLSSLRDTFIALPELRAQLAAVTSAADSLARIDTVAYVRFASVYKNFQAAGDFDKFVSELRPHTGESE